MLSEEAVITIDHPSGFLLTSPGPSTLGCSPCHLLPSRA